MNGNRFRSVSGLSLSADRAVWGLAELDFEVHGLSARRRELFMERRRIGRIRDVR